MFKKSVATLQKFAIRGVGVESLKLEEPQLCQNGGGFTPGCFFGMFIFAFRKPKFR